MTNDKKYPITEDLPLTVNEPAPGFMKSFASQEEAELFNLKKRLQATDMERLQTLCRMIRVGKMLSQAKIVK